MAGRAPSCSQVMQVLESGHGCTQGAPPCTAIACCTTEVTVPQRTQQVQVTLAFCGCGLAVYLCGQKVSTRIFIFKRQGASLR